MALIKTREPHPLKREWLNEELVVKPLGARRSFDIDRRFPIDPDLRMRENYQGYAAAMMAASVFTRTGEPAFTEDGLNADETDMKYFWDLWDEVSVFLGVRKPDDEDPAKNAK